MSLFLKSLPLGGPSQEAFHEVPLQKLLAGVYQKGNLGLDSWCLTMHFNVG